MRTLVIDTVSAACSVALFDDGVLIDARHELLGRGHAERLVPMIAELPDRGRADRILIDVGPGSFTGVRVGLAAARALAMAWGADVQGYGALALLAAMARAQVGAVAVGVAVTGGHGEYFVQSFAADSSAIDEAVSAPPEDAARLLTAALIVGDVAEALVAERGHGTALALLPDARHALLPGIAALPVSALYVRGADAKPMATIGASLG